MHQFHNRLSRILVLLPFFFFLFSPPFSSFSLFFFPSFFLLHRGPKIPGRGPFLPCRKPMSINSWCLIPKNRYLARVLTHLLSTDPYQLHIDCQAYQCKQKKLGFSILLGLKKKLWPIQNPKFQVHAGILLCKSKVERSFYFSYNPKPTLRL